MKLIAIISAFIILFSKIINADSETAKMDATAPDFTIPDVNGIEHSLSDYKEKYVVLEWINFGCPYVKKHYSSENMQKLQKKFTAKGVIWLSICSSAPGKQGYFERSEIKEKLSDYKAAQTAYLIDEAGNIGRMYGAKTTPDIRIINRKGILIYAGGIDNIASSDPDDIKNAVNYVDETLTAALAGRDVPHKVTKSYGCSVKYK